MSLEKIVEEAMNGRPLEMKEAFEEAIQARVLVALEEKYKAMTEGVDEEDEDLLESDDEDEDGEDMKESFDLSEDTMHADIDHMGGHDAMAKKHNITLTKHNNAPMGHYAIGKKKNLQKYLVHHYDGDHEEAKDQHPEVFK